MYLEENHHVTLILDNYNFITQQRDVSVTLIRAEYHHSEILPPS